MRVAVRGAHRGMSAGRRVTVFGAYGHTGRFMVATLRERGWQPILAGRDAVKLATMGREFRVASVDDPAALDRALQGAEAVINCSGPFLDTAAPVIEAALRAGIDYLDVCAEQATVFDVFERFDAPAKRACISIVPAMAFFGGLADLLATAAMGDWHDAERIDIAVALDSWHPTAGTRLTGARNVAPRRIVVDGELALLPTPPPTRAWEFAAPFGVQDVVALPMSEIVTIARHLRVREVMSWMTQAPLRDLRDASTPAPVAVDARGRSSQQFLVEVVVARNGEARRATASGRDIYAITAPLLVAALEAKKPHGALAPGAALDARALLTSLGDLTVRFNSARE